MKERIFSTGSMSSAGVTNMVGRLLILTVSLFQVSARLQVNAFSERRQDRLAAKLSWEHITEGKIHTAEWLQSHQNREPAHDMAPSATKEKPYPLPAAVIPFVIAAAEPIFQAQNEKAAILSGDQIVDHVSPSVVLILVGEGKGQLQGVGSGLIIRADGVILTAYHVVKGMSEVQVRLKNGDRFDRVQLIATDERRDVAALRIQAVGLPVLRVASASSVSSGAPVFVIANGAGLPWTASSGILSATRMADEVPGAGKGYRVLQFTAPLAPGSSGGVLVDAEARALGIVFGSVTPGQNVNFAVPVDSVAGLAVAPGGTLFASGDKLQLPMEATLRSPAPARTPAETRSVPPNLPPPEQVQLHTLEVFSKTIYVRRERLQEDLRKTALFERLGMRFANYGETADVSITVDRPFLTFDWTYTLVYQPVGVTLASGSIEAVDEFDAGPKLAARIIEQLASAAVLPRASLAGSGGTPARYVEPARRGSTEKAEFLRTCKTIFVESHTIWMKGNLLQDALYVRPELREWGIRIVDDRNMAEIYIDVTRPFLTYDWVYKIIDLQTGAQIANGKVLAIDGPAAAQRLAVDIVKLIRSVRPLPAND